jgi:hypothetical protein
MWLGHYVQCGWRTTCNVGWRPPPIWVGDHPQCGWWVGTTPMILFITSLIIWLLDSIHFSQNAVLLYCYRNSPNQFSLYKGSEGGGGGGGGGGVPIQVSLPKSWPNPIVPVYVFFKSHSHFLLLVNPRSSALNPIFTAQKQANPSSHFTPSGPSYTVQNICSLH